MRYVCILLAASLLGSGWFPGKLLASTGDSQTKHECEAAYSDLYPSYQRGELERVLDLAETVKTCTSLDRKKLEYAYIAETDVLVDLNRYEEALSLSQYVLENNVLQARRSYVSYILGDAAHAAYELGNDALSLHYYHLAVLESDEIDPLHRAINQEALAVLQVRTRNDDAALQTVLEAIKDLDETSSRAAFKYRASFHQMAAAALLFRCARGVSDYATWDPASCPDWSVAMEHQRMSKNFAEHLEGRERREAERARVNTDFLVARYKEEYNRALALLDTAAYLARENDNDWGLFQAESRRALIWSDKGEYARAFDIIRRIGRKLHSGEGSPFLPYMLTTQVRIAANAKDKQVAQRAMQELAALDGDVPDTLYKQASAAYASVFSNSTGDSSMPFWMLLSIAVGISVVLQFISTAARRHEHGVDLFNGRIPFLTALANPSTRDTSLLPRPTVDTAMPRNGTLLPHLPRTAADADTPEDETDAPTAYDAGADNQPETHDKDDLDLAGGDGIAWTADAEWMRSIGIDLDDLPTIQPPEPAAPAPTTLGDLLKAQLKQDPTVPCYDGQGRKTGTISLPERIINHAADDRFIAIRMEDRVVIAYRYARPQRLIVRQRPDGTMEKVELDQPVTAVPIAIIDTAA